jgi:hypothetical protein
VQSKYHEKLERRLVVEGALEQELPLTPLVAGLTVLTQPAAKVSLQMGGQEAYGATADEEGKVFFAEVRYGDYVLVISSPGFKARESKLEFVGERTVNARLDVLKWELTIRTEPGAEVTISRNGEVVHLSLADDEGEAKPAPLLPGVYDILVVCKGFDRLQKQLDLQGDMVLEARLAAKDQLQVWMTELEETRKKAKENLAQGKRSELIPSYLGDKGLNLLDAQLNELKAAVAAGKKAEELGELHGACEKTVKYIQIMTHPGLKQLNDARGLVNDKYKVEMVQKLLKSNELLLKPENRANDLAKELRKIMATQLNISINALKRVGLERILKPDQKKRQQDMLTAMEKAMKQYKDMDKEKDKDKEKEQQ